MWAKLMGVILLAFWSISAQELKNQYLPSSSMKSAYINTWPTDLIEFAKSLGWTDLRTLPSLDEIGNLLGTTTNAETTEVIRELASTKSGIELIKSFIGSQPKPMELKPFSYPAVTKTKVQRPTKPKPGIFDTVLSWILSFQDDTFKQARIPRQRKIKFLIPSYYLGHPSRTALLAIQNSVIPTNEFRPINQKVANLPLIRSNTFRNSHEILTSYDSPVYDRDQDISPSELNPNQVHQNSRTDSSSSPNKYLRSAGLELYATGRIHKANPKAFNLLPTMDAKESGSGPHAASPIE